MVKVDDKVSDATTEEESKLVDTFDAGGVKVAGCAVSWAVSCKELTASTPIACVSSAVEVCEAPVTSTASPSEDGDMYTSFESTVVLWLRATGMLLTVTFRGR